MPSSKTVKARRSGWCDNEFFHPAKINVGDRIRVLTVFPSDIESDRPLPYRIRECGWCLGRDEDQAAIRSKEPINA